jgi:hypothetical protein
MVRRLWLWGALLLVAVSGCNLNVNLIIRAGSTPSSFEQKLAEMEHQVRTPDALSQR